MSSAIHVASTRINHVAILLPVAPFSGFSEIKRVERLFLARDGKRDVDRLAWKPIQRGNLIFSFPNSYYFLCIILLMQKSVKLY
jgi:hypothetical protein